jgi:hypothetical protein
MRLLRDVFVPAWLRELPAVQVLREAWMQCSSTGLRGRAGAMARPKTTNSAPPSPAPVYNARKLQLELDYIEDPTALSAPPPRWPRDGVGVVDVRVRAGLPVAAEQLLQGRRRGGGTQSRVPFR